MAAIWTFVTDFGDSAVTVPLALLTLAFLGGAGAPRLAWGWGLTIAGCAAAIGGLKLVFGACATQLAMVHIVSPSGHTAMSTVVYGSLALLAGTRLAPRRRWAINLAAAVAILGIALSRLALRDHTPAEIAIGLVVGAAAVAVFGALLRRREPPALPLQWLLLSGAGLVALLHGSRWAVEPALHRLAYDLRLVLPWCR